MVLSFDSEEDGALELSAISGTDEVGAGLRVSADFDASSSIRSFGDSSTGPGPVTEVNCPLVLDQHVHSVGIFKKKNSLVGVASEIGVGGTTVLAGSILVGCGVGDLQNR